MVARASTKAVKRGRRPKGKGDPQQDILRAAMQEFARRGFDRATLRTIARAARVDPALVYHYFGNKDSLFMETMRTRMRRPSAQELPPSGPDAERAQGIVRLFLERWGGDAETAPFLALLRSASSNPKAAALLRRLFEEEITPYVAANFGSRNVGLRVGLIASSLLGLGVLRYIVGLEPVASAENDDLAAWVGPVLLHYLNVSLA